MKNRKGFTMVELLGAVVILGILMMVAIPSISSLINGSKNKYYISQKKNLESAAKSYYENNKIILREEGSFVDVPLEELVSKKYISNMVDATKADCIKKEPTNDNGEQAYTFVRIKKEGNRVTYTSHLYCPAYQDKKLGGGDEANIEVKIETDGVQTITINLKHNDNKIIKSYTYHLYKGENNIVKKTLTNKDSDVSITYDVSRFITAQSNTIKVYVYAVDEDDKTITVWKDVKVEENDKPWCTNKQAAVVKDDGETFTVEYSYECNSKNGCESRNNKGTWTITGPGGTQENPNRTETITVEDSLTGNTQTCDFTFRAVHKYRLTYDDNGGSGCSGQSIIKEKWLTWGTLCKPTPPTGGKVMEFFRWQDKANTNVVVTSETVILKHTTVKAQYIPKYLLLDDQTLNSGTYGTAYTSNAFNGAYDGLGPYTYTIVSGAPAGATIDSNNRKISFNNTTNVGTYKVVVKAKDQTTGKEATATMTIVINKKKITCPSTPAAKTYNGNLQNSGITCPTGSTTSGSTNGTNANTYYQTCTADSNHDFGGTCKVSWVINKAKLTCPSSPAAKTYNGNSQNSGISCPSGSSTSGDTSGTNANTYYQTCTADSNHDFGGTCKVSWVINKIRLTCPSSPAVKTYNGQEQASGVVCPTGSTSTGVTKATNYGTYEHGCSPNTNYDFASTCSVKWSISCIAFSKSSTYSAGSKVSYGTDMFKWTIVDVQPGYLLLAGNTVMGSGSFDNAPTKVEASIKNTDSRLKAAADYNCAYDFGSYSNNTDNMSNGPYWLKSGKVYLTDEVKKYSTSKTNFVHGWSGIETSPTASDIITGITKSCTKDTVLYSAGTTLNVSNSKSQVTFADTKCENDTTSTKYSDRFVRVHPQKGGSTSLLLNLQEKVKHTSKIGTDDWDIFESDVGNCYEFRWQLCGGTYSGDYYYMHAKDSDEFYAETNPASGEYSDHYYHNSDGNNNKYVYMAGWKPGGSDDCSNWSPTNPSAHGYCSLKVPNDTSENTGGSGGTGAHHYYDLLHYENACSKESKKVVSDTDVDIYYRPTMKVIRR